MVTLKVEIIAGCDILRAFKEAIALADKLTCHVDFMFNDVHCIASPGGDAEIGARGYYDAIRGDSKFKIASS